MPNWNDVLKEIVVERDESLARTRGVVDTIRRRYLAQLFEKTGRNVIAYYSGFLSKPGIALEDINDEDKNGFMMAVHKLDRDKGLDLILHTPGGSISATQSIVDYLHKMFGNNIRAIVPQIAMSAGTMLACSCRSIVMAKHSNLGPIDPHLSGIPAYGVIEEFKRACREVSKDPSKAAMWHAIISQYRPTFLGQCQDAIDWSNAFVQEQLETVMFEGQPDAQSKAASVLAKLIAHPERKRGSLIAHYPHSRHIHYEECRDMGLAVEPLEGDPELQDLVLTVHHCYMHSLMNTPSFKMIENHRGVAFVKHQVVQPVVQQVQQA